MVVIQKRVTTFPCSTFSGRGKNHLRSHIWKEITWKAAFSLSCIFLRDFRGMIFLKKLGFFPSTEEIVIISRIYDLHNHGITEWFSLERTNRVVLHSPLVQVQLHLVDQGPFWLRVLCVWGKCSYSQSFQAAFSSVWSPSQWCFSSPTYICSNNQHV